MKKPLSAIHIPNNKFTCKFNVVYFNTRIEQELINSLKENYTHKIADKASNYNLRVGMLFKK